MSNHKNVGARFGVYNGDAKGTLISINSQNVAYNFDHDLETTHVHTRQWYEDHTFALEENASPV